MGRFDALDVALLATGGVVGVVLALNEMHGQLVAAAGAYGAGWWVLSLERPRSGDPR